MSEICSVIQRKAKKIHFCDVCGKPIIPGSEYLAIRSAQDGRFWHNKEHIHCDARWTPTPDKRGLGLTSDAWIWWSHGCAPKRAVNVRKKVPAGWLDRTSSDARQRCGGCCSRRCFTPPWNP